MIGIVAFSFALREGYEPSKCNHELARNVTRLYKKYGGKSVIVAQWEIALALKALNVPVTHVVHRKPGVYLDSNQVMFEASEVLLKQCTTRVIPVANPFIHLIKCKMLVRGYGFKLCNEHITWIGFDRESDQPWTRGPLRLVLYMIRQQFFRYQAPPST
jgi:hypothetical protein